MKKMKMAKARNQNECDHPGGSRYYRAGRNASGIVLLVILVLLVVLAITGYTLTTRIAAQRHRNQYIIDYQAASCSCNSAIRYALAMLKDFNPKLIDRNDQLDFSDIFMLTEQEYEDLLDEWAAEQAEEFEEAVAETNPEDFADFNEFSDINDVNDPNFLSAFALDIDFNDPNTRRVPGPYGPTWPLVTEAIEFEIGLAKVKIEIEDENAKYPLSWMLMEDEELRSQLNAGLEIFCEWMDVNAPEIDDLKDDLTQIKGIKPFKLTFKPKKIRLKKGMIKSTPKTLTRTESRSRRGRGRRGRPVLTRTLSASDQLNKQSADIAKLLHSSLINTDVLARPTVVSEKRNESALKYVGMWGTSKVNINTAPRNVLEAAFVFGNREVEIADEIIARRREKPFRDINELKKELLRHSVSIDKCKDYIRTSSRFFTIRVTATKGVARTSAVIAITKSKGRIQKVGVISG